MRTNEKKIIAIVPARNESEFLGKTLDALKKQTHPLKRIILINDGSTDDTSEIARKFGVEVIDLENRGFRATGQPILADVINKGLEAISENECQYIMIVGADHILSPNYISTIIQVMVDNDLVIASGTINGESQRDTSPRGSGRIILYDFWKKCGLCYPSWYGFESYLIYRALVENYKIQVIRNAESWSQRRTGKTTNFGNYGKAMRALGYHPLYALGRIFFTFFSSPKNSLTMLSGYLHFSVKKYDIAPSVRRFQSVQMKEKIFSKFNSS